MNTFNFIGNIIKPKEKEQYIKTNSKGYTTLKLIIKQNEGNTAFIQLNAEPSNKEFILVKDKITKSYRKIPYKERFDTEKIKDVSYISKYYTNISGKNLEFISKMDFINCIDKYLNNLPDDTIFQVKGEFLISEYNGKLYKNFNIKELYVNNNLNPQLTLDIELYYNHNSLDKSDKKNRLILNGYVKQYIYDEKKYKYFPLQTQFNITQYDLNNKEDLKILKYRFSNLNPIEKLGYVKGRWEIQYVKGTQLIAPPIESLPQNIQFEIKNSGRDISEYNIKVVGKAQEILCLIRPNNTHSTNCEVFESLNISNEEFEKDIIDYIESKKEISKTISFNQEHDCKWIPNSNEITLDTIEKKEALDNPFN